MEKWNFVYITVMLNEQNAIGMTIDRKEVDNGISCLDENETFRL